MTTRLNFSIGPVQGFVAQSRRTRDLWGSSFLLAYLSAHALRGAEQAGGKIIQPIVDEDPLYKWVSGVPTNKEPQIGSVPNHFVVEIKDEGRAEEIAQAANGAFHSAWMKVCNAVREHFVDGVSEHGVGTQLIWSRQTEAFWEVMWTATSSSEARGVLAQRKHWRSYCPDEEPGDKCTVMHDLQELSGYCRSEGEQSRLGQVRFWEHIREHTDRLDIKENERLCAVALVKRLFPGVAQAAIGWKTDTRHWPSTVRIAAKHWLEQVDSTHLKSAQQYAEALGYSDFKKMDENLYHISYIRNKNNELHISENEDGTTRSHLADQLQDIYNAKGTGGLSLGSPPTFYALLLADGDRLGKLVSEIGSDSAGKALSIFTREVPGIVEKHHGKTVYAGGDDVLAMLPIQDALSCANELSDCYASAFSEAKGSGVPDATLSAAIVFTHIRLSLGTTIAKAHNLLDDVAKDANGRNSLATGVMKPSGMNSLWVSTWKRDGVLATKLVTELAEELQKYDTPGLSSSLIYRIRELLALLCGWNRWEPGSWGELPDHLDFHAFLEAEIFSSLSTSMNNREARSAAPRLAKIVAQILERSHAGPKETDSEVGIDALLLARFLANPRDDETL